MTNPITLTTTRGIEPRKSPCIPQKMMLSHRSHSISQEISSTLLVFNDLSICGSMNETPVRVPAYPNRLAKSLDKVYQSNNHPRSPDFAEASSDRRASAASSLSRSTTTL